MPAFAASAKGKPLAESTGPLLSYSRWYYLLNSMLIVSSVSHRPVNTACCHRELLPHTRDCCSAAPLAAE